MTRKFKLVGVLMAVVAMFALTASSASATFTSSTYPVTPHANSYTGCDYVFHSGPAATDITTDLICPLEVKGIDITFYSSSAHTAVLCHMVITPITGKPGFSFTTGIRMSNSQVASRACARSRERTSVVCPSGTTTKEAKYTVQPGGITITAEGATLSVS